MLICVDLSVDACALVLYDGNMSHSIVYLASVL